MSILEEESSVDGNSQGVVLALVGPRADCKDSEPSRSLRMYNLASLCSLSKWALSQPVSRSIFRVREFGMKLDGLVGSPT
jgi:hypothetical protein